jgi:hypothetical protein
MTRYTYTACLVFLRQDISEIQHALQSFAILNICATYRPNVYTPDIKMSFFKKNLYAENIKNITVHVLGDKYNLSLWGTISEHLVNSLPTEIKACWNVHLTPALVEILQSVLMLTNPIASSFLSTLISTIKESRPSSCYKR